MEKGNLLKKKKTERGRFPFASRSDTVIPMGAGLLRQAARQGYKKGLQHEENGNFRRWQGT